MTDKITIENFYKENFDTLVKRYTQRCGSEMDAEDFVQEAFVRAVKYIKTCKEGMFNQWFHGILSNSYKDFKRKQRAAGLTKDVEDCKAELPVSFQTSRDEIFSKEIRDLADAHPEPAREALRLALDFGYGETDISHIIPDMSHRQARYILDRFKKQLFERYKDSM